VQPHDDEAQATIARTFAGVEPFTVVDTVTFEECDPAAAESIHCASTQGRSTHAPAPSLNGFLRSMPLVPGDPEASGWGPASETGSLIVIRGSDDHEFAVWRPASETARFGSPPWRGPSAPDNANTVVPQRRCNDHNGTAHIAHPITAGRTRQSNANGIALRAASRMRRPAASRRHCGGR
jgi:hypothetical protein